MPMRNQHSERAQRSNRGITLWCGRYVKAMKQSKQIICVEKLGALIKSRSPKNSLEKCCSHSWKSAGEALRVSTRQAVLPALTASTLGHSGRNESPVFNITCHPLTMNFDAYKSRRLDVLK